MGMRAFFTFTTLTAVLLVAFWGLRPNRLPIRPENLPTVAVEKKLAEHSQEFQPTRVIKVTEGVYVAIGYGLANSIMLEGEDGLVIVDTLESAEAAVDVLNAFRNITKKPIRALVYTHYHPDHVFGAAVFASGDAASFYNQTEVGEEKFDIDIYAHKTTQQYLDKMLGVTSMINFKRGMRQFGAYMGDKHINSGIGPRLRYDHEKSSRLLSPNKFFDKELEVVVAGIRMKLFHAPGETNDQIVVWLPDREVLMAADNFYRAFPNIYAIRGTPSRGALEWARSLDLMRNLRAQYLVPSHSRPLTGKDFIYNTLTDYRDAVQFVHDQTARYMNKGYLPEEIVQLVQLPEHLSSSPYLQQFYGTVHWSIKGIFTSYLGWFSGDPAELNPLRPFEEAKRLSQLAGGVDKLLLVAQNSLDKEDFQWSLKLSSALLTLANDKRFQKKRDPKEEEEDDKIVEEAKKHLPQLKLIKSKALQALASKQTSANGRNYYLTCDLENNGFVLQPGALQRQRSILTAPLSNLFQVLSINLNAETCLEEKKIVTFAFSDISQNATVFLRKGVAEVQMRSPLEFEGEADLVVSLSSNTWREILAKVVNPAAAYLKGDIKVTKGTIVELASFLSLFKDDLLENEV